jgi:hypothetical protein
MIVRGYEVSDRRNRVRASQPRPSMCRYPDLGVVRRASHEGFLIKGVGVHVGSFHELVSHEGPRRVLAGVAQSRRESNHLRKVI